MALGMFLLGMMAGALGVTIWAVLVASGRESRREEMRKKNEFDVDL